MASSVTDLLNKFNEPDVYSVLCSYLYEFKNIPEYSTLCELAYLLDKDSFTNLIKYYEGQTITIPTRDEFRSCIRVLLLFQYFEIEKKPWKESLLAAGFQSSEGKAAQNQLNKLKSVIKDYNYGNRNY